MTYGRCTGVAVPLRVVPSPTGLPSKRGPGWVRRNGRGPHLEGRQEPQASSAFRTPTAGSLQSWEKYWSFRFSITLSSEYSGLISFRIYWFDLLAVQGTLKNLIQHHSSTASILWHSAFFIVQLSHPYMTTGKTIALTRRTFVGKVMSLLLNMLSRLVITFLPRSKHLLISWLQSPSDFGAPQNKVSLCSHCFPIYLP